jgi:ABC-type Fe3+/spermidine/putrescine transport system ATPase subunit
VSRVEAAGLTKRYGAAAALDEVSIAFPEGRLFALLGPSGSGKTTLLRSIAGFVRPDRGEIRFDGEPVQGVPPHRRGIGMVFQSYALFPHLSVADNVAFGLAVRGVPRRDIAREVGDALGLVRLTGLERRRPRQLSGGQQQRVALARALVTRPRVLLLDEPLSALDRRLRQAMQLELRALVRRVGITTILVTHDQEEALTMADRIAVLAEGRVVQEGTPREVYERPRTAFAATFLGDANLLDSGRRAIRPERLLLLPPDGPPPDGLATLPATVREAVYAGGTITYLCEAQGREIRAVQANSGGQASFAPGAAVRLAYRPADAVELEP